jgi:hypothetical protein
MDPLHLATACRGQLLFISVTQAAITKKF